MMRSKKFLGATLVVLMAMVSALLLHMRSHQQLGAPGVKTRPLPNSKNLEILMPEKTADYSSFVLTNAETILLQLPADTSFRVRAYVNADTNFWAQMTTVLMCSDRSSIHSPYICMTGQGWAIDSAHTTVEKIPMQQPFTYDLPVNKLLASKSGVDADGKPLTVRGIYVYWYVDANHYTADANHWMLWWLPRDLLMHGLLERWSYISVFAECLPGQEDATYERMKKLIAEVVPEFQLVPRRQTK